jgi:hypothetical protein
MNMTAPKLTRILGITVFATLVLAAGPALAGDADDVVFLDNGGRLRGVVVEEGPASVTIKLADGTIRSLARARVRQIAYGPAAPPTAPAAPAAPALPAAPVAVLAPPPPVPPAAGWRFTPDGAAPAPVVVPGPRTVKRSKGLMITGIVLMPVGAATLGLGAAACAVSSQCPNPQIGYADAVLMGFGSVMLVTGIVFTAVGASPRTVVEATSTPPRVQLGATVGPRSAALVGLF